MELEENSTCIAKAFLFFFFKKKNKKKPRFNISEVTYYTNIYFNRFLMCSDSWHVLT